MFEPLDNKTFKEYITNINRSKKSKINVSVKSILVSGIILIEIIGYCYYYNKYKKCCL